MRLRNKLAIAAVGTVAAISISTAAFAYWTSSGSGTGSATAGTSSAWNVTSDTASGNPLTPGGPVDSIAYHVKNDNSGVQHLNQVSISVSSTSNSGCTADDFSVGGELPGVAHVDTDADLIGDILSGATHDSSVTVQMVNGSGNQNACKGVTVHLAFAAS